MTDLAKRWLASPHWGGWRHGMSSQFGWLADGDDPPTHLPEWGELLPDLNHPGTRAFLLEDVRRAWPFCTVQVWAFHDGTAGIQIVEIGDGARRGFLLPQCPTEAEALIAALEAAPC